MDWRFHIVLGLRSRIRLFGDEFALIRTVSTVAPIPYADFHHLPFTDEGNRLAAERAWSGWRKLLW